MAAGFSGLFRTPVAAVFFALELFHSGVMEYDALLPAIVASLTATAVSGALGVTAGGVDLGAVSAPPTAGRWSRWRCWARRAAWRGGCLSHCCTG